MGREHQLPLRPEMRAVSDETGRFHASLVPAGCGRPHAFTLRLLLIALFSLPSLSACDGDNERDATVLQSAGVSVVVAKSDMGGDAAGIGVGGKVALVGKCLGIDGESVVWPPGTEVASEDPFTITVPNLGKLTVGDDVSTGGFTTGAESEIGKVFPDGCPTDRIVVLTP